MFNKNILKIEQDKAFSSVTAFINQYKKNNPKAKIISLGIGDVTKPIPKKVIEAMHQAVDDEASMTNFHGYGSYYGLKELREIISRKEYRNLDISSEEIFVGDGTKSDTGNILELFKDDIKILLSNPMYPIYLNSAYCLSKDIELISLDKNFKMPLPKKHYDVVYLCSPCNPVGNAYTYNDLKKWINWANKNDAVILYDNVYNAFIESKDVPKSIYEIKGSKKCAIEFRSYSKTASFTGVRCSYFVLPKEFKGNLINIWKERCINRFNGASYIAQVGAIASYSKEAQKEIKENIKCYKQSAKYLRKELIKLGFKVEGGIDSPYLWVNTIDNLDSFDAFKLCLEKLNIIVIPGEVFGSEGRKYVRISSFATLEMCKEAIKRIKKYYEKNN